MSRLASAGSIISLRNSLARIDDASERRSRDPIEVHADVCSVPGSVGESVCSTTWHKSNGTLRTVDPLGMACETEVSHHVRSGSFPLQSVYASHPFQVIVPDVPADDLGVIQNFRDIVKGAKGEFRGDQRVYSATMAPSVAIQLTESTIGGSAPALAVGVYVRLAFAVALAQAPELRFRVSNFFACKGPAFRQVTRDIVIAPKELGLVMEFFLPFYDLQAFGSSGQTQIYGPVSALRNYQILDGEVPVWAFSGGAPTVTIDGLGTTAGTVYAEAVGPYSPTLQNVAGAIGNS